MFISTNSFKNLYKLVANVSIGSFLAHILSLGSFDSESGINFARIGIFFRIYKIRNRSITKFICLIPLKNQNDIDFKYQFALQSHPCVIVIITLKNLVDILVTHFWNCGQGTVQIT